MDETINEKILNEIDKSNYSLETKEFLKKILLLEFQHIEEGRWMFGAEYDTLIRQYAKKFKVNPNEN